jgi:hypothetical protein
MNFIHSGATGDIVFSLPTIKAFGGGSLYITDFDQQRAESIAKLIEVQPYIDKVEIGIKPDKYTNLNKFRNFAGHHMNLVKCHFMGAGIPVDQSWTDGWLTLPDNPYKLPAEPYCVINRTTNYADPNCNWVKEIEYLKTLAEKIYFIGYKDEYDLFCNTFTPVDFYECDFLEGAYLIQNAVMFTGCYSAWSTIAMGLGREYRMEQAPYHTCSSLLKKRETLINV